jgi:hypothetical protein
MITIVQGESLQIPATVTGTKSSITNLVVKLKKSTRGEIPSESAATAATLTVEDFTNDVITNGYLFSLTNTSSLSLGIYYVNYQYEIVGKKYKGNPMKVLIKESVV